MKAMTRFGYGMALGLFLLCLSPALAQGQAQYIRVATFNIAKFGETQEYERSLISLVNVIVEADADLVCLQEVEPNDLGSSQVGRLVDLLNKAAGFYGTKNYDFIIPGEHTGDETVAFLWRKPVQPQSDPALMEHEEDADHDGKPTFQRVPTVMLFKAGKYDFYVVNCHLYTKIAGVSSEGRKAEFVALVGWLKSLAQKEEKDAIVLGDFNRFLGGKSAWPHLMISNHKNYYRFPLLEAIQAAHPSFDPLKDEAPEDKYSTTTSAKKSIYDQVLISKGSYAECTVSPQFDLDVGIVPFDNDKQYEWFVDDWYDVTGILSDHRPVWIRLRTDLPDDD